MLAKVALADGAITFLWVISVASMRPVAVIIASSLHFTQYEFLITVGLLAVLIFFFNWLGATLGGAQWNLTSVLAFYSGGMSKDSVSTMAIRFPAQTLGAVGGVLVAKELIPPSYKHLLHGPQLLVDLKRGTLAEFVLTFVLTLAVLLTVSRGPKSMFLKNWLIILATVAVVLLGSGYTGPSLNPADAFGWAYANDKYDTLEHLCVYWLAPLTGALVASWVFRLFFNTNQSKEKTA